MFINAFGTFSGIHFTPHDVVKPSCTTRINIVCKTTTSYMLRECFGYIRVILVCPSCDHRQASYMLQFKIGLFTKFVTKIGQNLKFHIIVCQNRLGMTPALTPNTGFCRLHTIRRRLASGKLIIGVWLIFIDVNNRKSRTAYHV